MQLNQQPQLNLNNQQPQQNQQQQIKQQQLVQKFIEITKSDTNTALLFLQQSGFNIELAIQNF